MPSGFNYQGENFDRTFMTDYEIIDRFTGYRLWTWGWNGLNGMLGVGSSLASARRSSPGTTTGGGVNWSKVAGGGTNQNNMGGIKTDGTLWMCGYNAYGQIGNSTTTGQPSPVSPSGGGTTWKQLSIGNGHTTAVKTDGTLWTWGNNTHGQLGTGNVTSRSSPGTTAGGGTNWKQVAGGSAANSGYTAAIKTDGTLWTWGLGTDGQLGDGTAITKSSPITTAGGGTNWKFVACGYYSTAAVKTDGTLWTWGYNNYGQLGDGSTTARSSPGTTAGGGTTWKFVNMSVNTNRTAGIKTDGTLWTWGWNGNSGLGDGTSTNRSSPGTTAGGGTTWKQVAMSYGNSVGVKTDGTVWTWGFDKEGNNGAMAAIGSTYSSPGTTVSVSNNWKEIACSYYTIWGIAD